jgi:DNA-binding IscR family transcriptional regulator
VYHALHIPPGAIAKGRRRLKVSTRGEYGMRAMVALARQYGNGPIALSTVAHDSTVPAAYLEQLMGVLRRSGLVHSTRVVWLKVRDSIVEALDSTTLGDLIEGGKTRAPRTTPQPTVAAS